MFADTPFQAGHVGLDRPQDLLPLWVVRAKQADAIQCILVGLRVRLQMKLRRAGRIHLGVVSLKE